MSDNKFTNGAVMICAPSRRTGRRCAGVMGQLSYSYSGLKNTAEADFPYYIY